MPARRLGANGRQRGREAPGCPKAPFNVAKTRRLEGRTVERLGYQTGRRLYHRASRKVVILSRFGVAVSAGCKADRRDAVTEAGAVVRGVPSVWLTPNSHRERCWRCAIWSGGS